LYTVNPTRHELAAMTRIPKILHYCFGMDPSFGGKPWSLVHYVCVKSAIERIKPAQAYIYYEYEPTGAWWQQTQKMLTSVKINAPRQIFGNPLQHVAHRADIVRLEALIRQGGIYLDTDVLVHQPFDHLLKNSVVMGEEGINAEYGLANAVIMAEPGAPFLKRWYEEYRSFRYKGEDEYWNEHSVRIPLALSKLHQNEVRVLPHTAFYWPLWTDEHLKLIYGSPAASVERSWLANHLWESKAWEPYLEGLTPDKVREIDSNFHSWARPFLVGLPAKYGAPSLRDRWIRSLRLQKRGCARQVAHARIRLGRVRQLGFFGSARRLIAKVRP
jgi:Glycosyltransferase sugar-binding region containing DXD motif